MEFGAANLLEALEEASDEVLDGAPFGVVRLDRDHRVTFYNRYESRLSGLAADRVVGRNFFLDVAPCTNNFLVAQRYEAEGALDEVIDYVFTYKLAPTPVRLRMVRGASAQHAYLIVEIV